MYGGMYGGAGGMAGGGTDGGATHEMCRGPTELHVATSPTMISARQWVQKAAGPLAPGEMGHVWSTPMTDERQNAIVPPALEVVAVKPTGYGLNLQQPYTPG